ncbi:amino acid ABC transporter permease [Niallia sp. 01092]|uniref:amino acid ABC transporter permease n=1 Tax=Niallia sp. 01092 TaxID=3457759 RepID=UPI003FD446C8
MNWQAIVDCLPLYEKALGITLWLAFWGILISFIIGIICSFCQYFRIPILKRIAAIYIELSRNTPLLVQLFFLYYGLPKMGVTMSKESCAIIGLAFLGGSYIAEAFRGGLEGVPKIQVESGKAIGLSTFQLARYVVFPQALSISVPMIGANCIFLLKETSIFSGIAILELMNTTRDLIGMYYRTDEYLLVLVIAYSIILLPLSLVLTWLERKVRHGTFGY